LTTIFHRVHFFRNVCSFWVDKKSMRSTYIQPALGLIIIALAFITTILRIEVDGSQAGASQPMVGPAQDFCVGIDYPGNESALVCSQGPANVVDEAIQRVRLPKECLNVTLPGNLRQGDRIFLASQGRTCKIEKIERLFAAQRLLCGAGIDVNRDSAEDLKLLPGIGEVRARAIVGDRKAEGFFDGPSDLERVSGIGPKIVERMAPFLDWPKSR
jgi:competence ComEA-like helix-hairpin-helix protein